MIFPFYFIPIRWSLLALTCSQYNLLLIYTSQIKREMTAFPRNIHRTYFLYAVSTFEKKTKQNLLIFPTNFWSTTMYFCHLLIFHLVFRALTRIFLKTQAWEIEREGETFRNDLVYGQYGLTKSKSGLTNLIFFCDKVMQKEVWTRYT